MKKLIFILLLIISCKTKYDNNYNNVIIKSSNNTFSLIEKINDNILNNDYDLISIKIWHVHNKFAIYNMIELNYDSLLVLKRCTFYNLNLKSLDTNNYELNFKKILNYNIDISRNNGDSLLINILNFSQLNPQILIQTQKSNSDNILYESGKFDDYIIEVTYNGFKQVQFISNFNLDSIESLKGWKKFIDTLDILILKLERKNIEFSKVLRLKR